MIKIIILLTNLFFFQAFASTSNTENFDCKETEQVHQEVRSFMLKNDLILPTDELSLPELGISLKWTIFKVVPAKSDCLVVMAVCTYLEDGSKDCPAGSPFEVLTIVSDKKESVGFRVVPFEETIDLPKKAVATIGAPLETHSAELSYYYVMLSGKDLVDAYKSFLSKTSYAGFSGVVQRGQKASYDPTVNRDWEVIEAKFSLRRGDTAESLDIQAFQLDGLDSEGAQAYWDGCIKPNAQQKMQCLVAPWGQSFIRDLKPFKK